ncbi:thiazolylpeptide-type bacteriocin [Nonomuraea sp. NPDC048881]|uniref:thiazolylpeptide-type bacteriocin n=1 Tax=Nonomuraea sp. NPDC048881 TaxID=3155030 RepID=UPI0033DD4BF8
MTTLSRELRELESETFEISDIAEFGDELAATSSSCCSCSTSSTCSTSSSSCGSSSSTSCSCSSTSSCH